MASRWSSEFNMTEHKDLQATTMAMNRSSEFILLTGKRHIALKNLNDPLDTLKKYPRNNKYEVGSAEWNPTDFNGHLFALSMNQKVEIFSWRESNLSSGQALKFHTRLVTDINWHKFNPNLLASASLDSFTHVWDLRDPRRPSVTYSAIASAHHVRWNKLSTHLMATAHDGDIRIWDQRKGTAPIQYISAHVAKIHGLDWSQTHEYQLASCSQDGTVKFFDVTHPKCAESVIQAASPIWRARYTPFGEGLVTVLISVSPRNDNGLLLWNLSNQSIPVHTFVGHTDVVLEFEWRKNRIELSEYQLITWSKDQSLRIWSIEPFLQKLCGYDFVRDSLGIADDLNSEVVSSVDIQSKEIKDLTVLEAIIPAVEATNEMSFSSYDNFEYSDKYSLSQHDPLKSLEMEFLTLSTNFTSPNVKFVEMNVSDRICVVAVTVNSLIVTLKITFPHSYPTNAAPSFQIDEGSSIDDILRTKILKLLKQTAQQRVKKYRTCLETCLNQLITTLEHSVQIQESESKPPRLPTISNGESSLLPVNSYFYETAHDVHIPFPRTCGAKFCSVDKLVCFHRPSSARRSIIGADTATPRSFSAIAGGASISGVTHSMVYMLSGSGQDITDSPVSYFVQNRNSGRNRNFRNGSIQMGGGRFPGKSLKNVTIYDCSKLFFTHKELAEKYIFDIYNAAVMCKKNAEIAGLVGRMDLVQVWTLAGLIAAAFTQRNEPEEDIQWTEHPFFKPHIEHLIMHYAKMSDVQTAAMLCCAFTAKPEPKGTFFNKNTNNPKSLAATQVCRRKRNLKPGGSPYHTIHPADTSLEGWNFPAPKHNRSNSWSESLDDLRAIANILEHKEVTEVDFDRKLLDNAWVYDEFKRKYAEILHRWNLLEARAQVGKFLQTPKDSFKAMEFLIECQQCKKQILRPPYCSNCRKIVLRCAICRVTVRGSSNFCFTCGHGGHTKHLTAWFKSETFCPTGCGCKCTAEALSLLES